MLDFFSSLILSTISITRSLIFVIILSDFTYYLPVSLNLPLNYLVSHPYLLVFKVSLQPPPPLISMNTCTFMYHLKVQVVLQDSKSKVDSSIASISLLDHKPPMKYLSTSASKSILCLMKISYSTTAVTLIILVVVMIATVAKILTTSSEL